MIHQQYTFKFEVKWILELEVFQMINIQIDGLAKYKIEIWSQFSSEMRTSKCKYEKEIVVSYNNVLLYFKIKTSCV